MRRRAKATKGKPTGKARPATSERRLLEQRLAEVLVQQAATAEILRVISSSPTDVAPVFEAIAASATRLCNATNSGVFRFDGELIHLVAHHNWDPQALAAVQRTFPLPPGRRSITARAILNRAVAHADIAVDPEFTEEAITRAGFRTALSVPMLRDAQPVGAITVTRMEPRPFSEAEIALLGTFANQAVIAIENVRLFTEAQLRNRELSDSLSQQTATAAILRVISSSPTDIRPVLDAVAESAAVLCEAVDAAIFRRDGDRLRLVAHRGPIPFGRVDEYSVPLVRGTILGRTMLDARTCQVADLQAESAEFPEGSKIARQLGHRTTVAVPLLREGAAVGVITVRRDEARPFTERQVALLQTFADQAAIAIENVGLFTELEQKNRALVQAHAQVSEALEQQTATAEILRTISSSPTDVHPVFDTIVRNARRLCGADSAAVFTYDGDMIHVKALDNANPEQAKALRAAYPIPASRGHATGRAILEGRTAHIPDVLADPEYGLHELRDIVRLRSLLSVPMVREGTAIGAITVQRWTTSRPFSEDQIALLETFADQAVIAIENVRLFTELEARNRDLTQALDQQTATSEILRVISSSPTDVEPVFRAIVGSGRRLCHAHQCILVGFDGETLSLLAMDNYSQEGEEALHRAFPYRANRTGTAGRAVLDRRVVHIPDVMADPEYSFKAVAEAADYRAHLGIPLFRENDVIGVLIASRTDPGPFSQGQIDLLETFADQAVIAIQNVRLFRELEARNRELTESLEQQTATAEILRVISRSPTDVHPVFDTIARSAARLCEAERGFVFRFDGERLHFVAHHGVTAEGTEIMARAFPLPASRGSAAGRAVLSGNVEQVPDVQADPDYVLGPVAEVAEFRSTVGVPMLRDGVPIGAITVSRSRPGALPDRHVDLLQTFADQAVIAVENVRLFTELNARNSELRVALERQTATSELLKVIGRSGFDLQPVFDTLAENAATLCDAKRAVIFRFDGRFLRLAAGYNVSSELRDFLERNPFGPRRSTIAGRAALARRTIHIHDVLADREYDYGARQVDPYRTMLAIPMLRADEVLGVIVIHRYEVRPFTDGQIALLETFADQAAIAIENARLLAALQAKNADLTDALEQQTATSEILRVISTSPTNLQPVLDAVVRSAARFCAAPDASIFRLDGENLRADAHYGPVSQPAGFLVPVVRGTVAGRSVLERQAVGVTDLQVETDEFPEGSSLARQTGQRAMLSAPLLREGAPIGVILLRRAEAVPFTGKHIELLKTFADQAVIAIENVRLFKELEARNRELTETLEQQTATAEILGVISSSPTDVQPVFDTIASSAARLCEARDVIVFRVDGDTLRLVAHHGQMPAGDVPLHRGTVSGRSVLDGRVIHVNDRAAAVDEFPLGSALARERGNRTMLAVPLLREGIAIGNIAVRRDEVRPFSDQQIALLKTFADQAVIAIENVRLFQELEARTRELTRSVGELKALGEVSQAVSSTLELETVLATIVSRAVELSGSEQGIVYEFDEATQTFHHRATHEVTPEHVEALRATPIRLGEGAIGRAGVTRQPVEVVDIEAGWDLVAPQVRPLLARAGMRSLLAVPLVREDRLLGGLAILRRDRGAFSPEVVATLRTFATQSALAIHNAGLFREIQRQKQYSEALVETSPVAIVTMDLHGTVVGWNPGAERLFGYTSAEAVGRDVDALVATPEIRDEVHTSLRHALAGERIRTITRRARKDGSLVDVEISAVPVSVDGVQMGSIAIYHDITELLQARRDAETANEAKSAFLATMSHEIRTPMNAVIGMSGLLLNTALTDEQREYAEVVRQSGDTLLTVINDILDFSKIEAGRLELESQAFDLRECVEATLDLVANRAAEKGLDLAYLMSDATPAAIIGDVTRLRQILLNLLSNAVKFTESGEVVLSVTAGRVNGEAPLHDITLSVRDTGIGIPPDRLGRLFQSFSQVDASTTRRYGGTGLGLAISQRLAELMGGRITVTSELGRGSEFRFTIRALATEAPTAARRDLSGVQPALHGKHLLVVDDNATNRRIVTVNLDAWGVRARATGSPAEALAWIRDGERFDVGILDMHMPEMDGVTLARAIREHVSARALPLILFTSLGRREARAESEGFAAYLHKPMKPSQLFDVLVSVLGDHPVQVRAREAVSAELDRDMARRHPLRILLAEDNVVNQKLALRLLEQMGYRADVAADGLEAIDAVARQTYDVVLMDVQMPVLDGFEASREINRRWPGPQRPRIIAMTANAMQGDRELCIAAGMDDYVAKPIHVEELVAALERSRSRDAAPAVATAIDRARLDELVATMGGEFVAELIDTFVEDGRELIATLRRALSGTDVDAFRRAAHSLKSNGETLGASALAALARELESMARGGHLHGASDRLEPLARECESAARALQEIRRGLAS